MPRPVRHDPEIDHPVDGDFQIDRVDNKNPAFEYALLDSWDLARKLPQGYVIEKWGEGCAVPRMALPGEPGTDIKVNELTLCKVSKERHALLTREPQRAADRNEKQIRKIHNKTYDATTGEIA